MKRIIEVIYYLHKHGCFNYLKSQDIAFIMVVLSQIAAKSPSAMFSRAAQQSWNVPALSLNTF